MKSTFRNRTRRAGLALMAVLAGGTTLQTCETRIRDAITSGTRNYISALLDPTGIIEAILATEDTTTEE